MSDRWNPSREEVIEGLKKVWDAFDHMEHELYADYVFDALKMLKDQEPRVLTLEEANGVLNKSCLVILEIIHRGLYSVIRHGDYFTMEPSIANDYGKTFRFWSARPTYEQMEATPWNT